MQLNVYDENLTKKGTIFNWNSLFWEESYNGDGSFQLEIQQSATAVDLFIPWRYVELIGRETPMVIVSVQTRNGAILVNGFPATYILRHRTSTKKINNVAAELAIRELVSNMSPWNALSLGEEYGIEDIFEGEVSCTSVYEYCQTICKAVDMGFRIVKRNENLLFECYKPSVNERAKYSTNYGNLGNICQTISDVNYFNVVTVIGEDSNGAQILVQTGNVESTGSERHETIMQGDFLEENETLDSYKKRLEEQGKASLAKQTKINSITFTIDDNRAKLGDIITVIIPDIGVSMAIRTTSYRIVNQDNKTSITIGVGEPITKLRRG